jgi:hypothetical protein
VSEPLLKVLRRALAVAILLFLPLLLWGVAADPLIRMVTDRQDEIVTLSERLARLKATIARIPALRRNVTDSTQRMEAAGGVWTGTSEAALAATLQDRLRQAVSSSEGVVKSTSHVRGADEGGLQTVRIRFSIEGTLDTVLQTLTVIENSRPVIFVDSMTIVAPATFSAEKPPLLGLDLEVTGYLQASQE